MRCIKPPRSGFAWLDACNRKPKAELLRIMDAEGIKMKNFASNKDILKKVLNHIGKYKIFLFFSVALAAISVILTLYIPILTGEAVD